MNFRPAIATYSVRLQLVGRKHAAPRAKTNRCDSSSRNAPSDALRRSTTQPQTWGFEEYRRDAEDGGGWFMIGFMGDQRFESEADALSAAMREVEWLADVVRSTERYAN